METRIENTYWEPTQKYYFSFDNTIINLKIRWTKYCLGNNKTNDFLITRTNIPGLQFGRDKCEKMHAWKKSKNSNTCVDFKVDAWKNEIFKDEHDALIDKHIGKEILK